MTTRARDRTTTTTDAPVRLSVTFDPDDYAEIKGIAKEKRVSTAWVIREAVTAYLNARSPLFARER